MGVNHANCGTMQRAVPALLAFGFNDLKLHRIEAASLPRNERSIHLLEKCGFQREGYAREFMEINGTREDHVLYGILKQDFLST
jgi:ribosomal-protein-alanine N-acetyltransferase